MALAWALAAAPAVGQVVGGVVRDSTWGAPLPGVEVTLMNERGNGRVAATTDSAGAFEIRAASAGVYWLRAEPPGFATLLSRPFVLERGDSITLTLAATQQPITLEGVTGTSRRQNRNFAGFLDRQRSGWGTRYLGPEQLARMRTATVAHLLMGLAPGLDAEPHGAIRFLNRGRNCTPILVVDGVRYTDIPVDHLVVPSSIRAVEVYMQPEWVPPQLTMAPFNTCGAVAIWTHYGLGIE